MAETPLYTALRLHRKQGRASFHTPGHKGNPNALPGDLLSLDFTELPDTDSLYEAGGPILRAEELAARLFSARRTLFSAGGCTLCIQAMLRLALPGGGKLACSRVVHRSAVNTMALLDITPVWALPGQLLAAVENESDLQAAYVTSPNYYGQLADIPALAAACRKRGIPLLVDNAHGAHLAFTTPNLHPLALGASMTACSAHKTLNVLTGGAWLNIGDERFVPDAKDAMALFGSTSPGYPVMASLDWARAWLEENQAYPALQQRVQRLRSLALSRGMELPAGPCDPTRLTLRVSPVGLTGEQAAGLFRENGVEPEYADGEYVVFIATPFTTDQDFSRLERAISALPLHAPLPCGEHALPPLPPVETGLRRALFSSWEEVLLERAVGRTAARPSCPCPPGVPIVMPGEKITKEAVEFLKNAGFLTVKVIK